MEWRMMKLMAMVRGRNMAAWVAFVYDRPVDIINIIEAGNYECAP